MKDEDWKDVIEVFKRQAADADFWYQRCQDMVRAAQHGIYDEYGKRLWRRSRHARDACKAIIDIGLAK